MSSSKIYCQLCAELKVRDKLVDLLEEEGKLEETVSKLTRVNAVSDFTENQMPKTVCFLCLETLDNAYNFVTSVERAQFTINEILFLQSEVIEDIDSTCSDEEIEMKTIKIEFSDLSEEQEVLSPAREHLLLKEEEPYVEQNCHPVPQQPDLDSSSDTLPPTTEVNDDNSKCSDNEIEIKTFKIEFSDSPVEQEVDSPEQEHPITEQEKPFVKQTFHHLPEQPDLESSSDTLPPTTEINNVEIDPSFNGDKEEGTWASYRWLCKYCDLQFTNIKELRIHSMESHNSCLAYRCPHCISETDSFKKFLKHAKKHEERLKYSCYICYKKYTVLGAVRKHYRYVHDETDHMCPGCISYFATEQELNQHMKEYYKKRHTYTRYNPPPKNLTCPSCNKVLKNRRAFLYHQRTAHTGENKIATCDQCGKSYTSKNTLKAHLLLHNEENPFKCEICKKSFKISSQLKEHFTVHSTDKPFKCDECGRGFRQKRQLNSHKIIHTDSLPFKCDHCSKQFRFKSTLVIHERVHLGVKPYSCDICQRDFTNWSNFNKHMKRKHDKNMAKEKSKLKGLQVDPRTGELSIKPEAAEWLNKMKQQKPGRPKKVHKNNSN